MKLKNKSILFVLSIFFAIAAISCTTTTEQNLYTMIQENGQLIFIRPTVIDDKKFILRNTNLDISIQLIESKVTDNNIVNYTVFLPKESYNSYNDVELFFKTPSAEKISLKDVKILYKNFNKKNQLEVRFTSTITGEDVKALLENADETQIGVSLKDKTNLYKSKKFSQKLFEAGIIINE
ncbi:MAG: hypothetical protein K6A43_04195 [Treponema sp.]|nr:hypothetical protein [Treponema sp.]